MFVKMLEEVTRKKWLIEELSLIDEQYNTMWAELNKVENALRKIIKVEHEINRQNKNNGL